MPCKGQLRIKVMSVSRSRKYHMPAIMLARYISPMRVMEAAVKAGAVEEHQDMPLFCVRLPGRKAAGMYTVAQLMKKLEKPNIYE